MVLGLIGAIWVLLNLMNIGIGGCRGKKKLEHVIMSTPRSLTVVQATKSAEARNYDARFRVEGFKQISMP